MKNKQQYNELVKTIDKFVIVNKELSYDRFDYLFDEYAGDIINWNVMSLSEDLEIFFMDSSKHQVFDWFKSEFKRTTNIKFWDDINDISHVIASYIIMAYSQEAETMKEEIEKLNKLISDCPNF